jgi:hypothetical protein
MPALVLLASAYANKLRHKSITVATIAYKGSCKPSGMGSVLYKSKAWVIRR